MGKHAAPRRTRAEDVTPEVASSSAPNRTRGGARRAVRTSAPRRIVRAGVLLGGVAALSTGTAVAIGLGQGSADPGDLTASAASADLSQVTTATRAPVISRSTDRRAAADPAKAASLAAAAQGEVQAVTESVRAEDGDPKAIASALLSDYGWSGSQFDCLDKLWTRESNWNTHADNPSSSAYGIPQALPGSKMSSAGPNWQTNPVTQIKWGLGYIQGRYGTPCSAWGHSEARGWY